MSLTSASLKRYLLLSVLCNVICITFIIGYIYPNNLRSDVNPKVNIKQNFVAQAVHTSTPNSAPTLESIRENTLLTDNNIDLVNQADNYFSQLNFVSAFELLDEINHQDQSAAVKLQEKWLNKCFQWIEQQRFTHVDKVVSIVLNYNPHQESWQLVNVALQTALNNHQETISIYRQLMLNSFDPDKDRVWLFQVHKIAGQVLDSMKADKAWQQIISFSLFLLEEEPNYPPYLYALAHAYAQTDSPEYALPYLDQLNGVAEYQHKISALYAKIDNRNGANIVNLSKHNEHYLVDAIINQSFDAKLLIDTGASITVISTAYYEQLKHSYAIEVGRTLQISTAGGEKKAFSIIADEFSIGDYQLKEFEMVVLDLPNFETSNGLLGMNFLKHFKFSIDQDNSYLILDELN